MQNTAGTEDFHHMSSLADSLLAWFPADTKTLVAFSGGADSALVVAAAARALGPSLVTAATAVSPSLAAGELDHATAFAHTLHITHLAVPTHEMEVEGYRANGTDRCYFCKATLLDELLSIANDDHYDLVLTGTNADDVRSGFRPGIRAAQDRGARAPLAELGITKTYVRAISKDWGLATWNKPAMPCLSSRIAYGVQITPARLRRVDNAELSLRSALAAEGIPVCGLRVRDLGSRVRIEVDAEFVEILRRDPHAENIRRTIEQFGFSTAELTIELFVSGSLNSTAATSRRDTERS